MTAGSLDTPLLTERDGAVLTLTLNRSDRLNALTHALFERLCTALGEAARDPQVRCVIVTGAGRGFCSGGDLGENAAVRARDAALPPAERRLPRSFHEEIAEVQRWTAAVRLLRDMPKPTIAMVNGPCAGAGLSIAGACDLRFASHAAFFLSAFADVGFSGDLGGSWYWTQILGSAGARELYLLSERVPAEQALARGMIHKLFDTENLASETMAVAQRLARRRPEVHRYLKRNLNGAEVDGIDTVLERETLGGALSAGAWLRSERKV